MQLLLPSELEKYTVTLATRTFRALMAITVAYDLDTRQYDAVNTWY